MTIHKSSLKLIGELRIQNSIILNDVVLGNYMEPKYICICTLHVYFEISNSICKKRTSDRFVFLYLFATDP